jgi:hypothetical protein
VRPGARLAEEVGQRAPLLGEPLLVRRRHSPGQGGEQVVRSAQRPRRRLSVLHRLHGGSGLRHPAGQQGGDVSKVDWPTRHTPFWLAHWVDSKTSWTAESNRRRFGRPVFSEWGQVVCRCRVVNLHASAAQPVFYKSVAMWLIRGAINRALPRCGMLRVNATGIGCRRVSVGNTWGSLPSKDRGERDWRGRCRQETRSSPEWQAAKRAGHTPSWDGRPRQRCLVPQARVELATFRLLGGGCSSQTRWRTSWRDGDELLELTEDHRL